VDITDNPFQDAAKVTEDPWNPPEVSDAPPDAPPPDHRNSIAWERERSFSALKDTLLDVLLEPGATFRAAHPEVSLWPALGFFLIFGSLGYAGSTAVVELMYYLGQERVLGHNLSSLLPSWTVVFVPVTLTVHIFINAALMHLALMVTGAKTLRYGASFRICAYCTGATALFNAVPFVGHWVSMVLLFIVEVAAIQRMHRTSGGKAAFAAIAPVILRWAFYGGLALIGIYSIASLFD